MEQKKNYSREYHRRLKYDVMSYYSKGEPRCECCAIDLIEFLCIDHINGGGLSHFREIGGGGHKFYLWLKKNEFPEGFRVLCHNCNASLSAWGYCPHRSEKRIKVVRTISEQISKLILDAACDLWSQGIYPNIPLLASKCNKNKGVIQKHRRQLIECGKWPCEVHNYAHRGEDSPNSKLNVEKVKQIRTLLNSGCFIVDIARRFGVAPVTIREIKNQLTWKHVQ